MKYLIFIFKTFLNFFIYFPKLTPKRIVAYFKGNWRLMHFNSLPNHIKEQFFYRLTKMNPECLKNKQCPCTCPYPEKQLDDSPCENDCYPFMLDEESWNLLCKVSNLDKDEILKKGIFIFLKNS